MREVNALVTDKLSSGRRRRRNDKKDINIREVAREAGVSIATVSRVFQSPDRVANLTREHVQAVISRLGYTPNILARSLAIAKTHSIVALVPDIANPFFSEVIRGIEQVAQQNGYTVLLGDTQYDLQREQAYAQLIPARQADGLITLMPHIPRIQVNGRPPIVNACECVEDNGITTVRTDNIAGAKAAVGYLIALGHRNIAHIIGRPKSPLSIDRQEGYRRALAEAGLGINPHLLSQGDFSAESGIRATERLFSSKQRFTAIFCSNDEMALGAINAIRLRGLRVPQEISIIGFDDIRLARYFDPPLTTVAQPMRQIGQEAMKLLIEILLDKDVPPRKCVLAESLVVRKSAVAPPT